MAELTTNIQTSSTSQDDLVRHVQQKEAHEERAVKMVTVSQRHEFDEIIDVRSEDEFAQDHLPGAVNFPVLNNAERSKVGTIYTQVSAFEAKKIGAALISANISRHLNEHLNQRPRQWRPLIYCWRGGGRSAAFAHVLGQIGWRTGRMAGGYKAYRQLVINELSTLPSQLTWQVVCGMTGTGKSRLLHTLHQQGAQILDLEALASHRGSVLGHLPSTPQPSQKLFESMVWDALHQLSPDQPVFVESESKKVGNLRVPEFLIEAMRASTCIIVNAPIPVRVKLLQEDYAHFISEPDRLNRQLDCLRALHGHQTITKWQTLANSGQWATLVEELLLKHYDPAYSKAIDQNFPRLPLAQAFTLNSNTETALQELATTILTHIKNDSRSNT